MLTTEQSLRRLFSRRGWHKGSELNESTARVFKMRYFENKLELETQMKVLKACGFKLKTEMQWEEEVDRENVFWSFDQSSLSEISDDVLIEKVLLYLDIDDIKLLFRLFPVKKIQPVWKDSMLSQEPMYHQLNRLYAFLFFEIQNPDKYIRDFKNKKHSSIQCRD
jgi:hypothetical protein